jgi:hypothetical protein
MLRLNVFYLTGHRLAIITCYIDQVGKKLCECTAVNEYLVMGLF